MKQYTIADVQRDWRCLDAEGFVAPRNVRLISHEQFTARPGLEEVEYVAPGALARSFRLVRPLFDLLYPLRLRFSPYTYSGWYLFYRGMYEEGVVRTCRSLLRPGMTFVDVGANVGLYSVVAGHAVGRAPTQLGWYAFAAQQVDGNSVLDVGCGLADGLRILQAKAAYAHGQDLDPRLAGPNILVKDLADIEDKSYDMVVSIDVLEHVPNPQAFLGELVRIARRAIFLSTPNWTLSRCQWPYHYKEYTPREFELLLKPLGRVVLFKGSCDGYAVYPVRFRTAYSAMNWFRAYPPTAFVTRCVNRAIPIAWRIQGSNAAWLWLR